MATVSESKVESAEIVLQGDLNGMGRLFGGRLVSMIDKVAAIAAIRHVRGPVVTLSIDSLVFKRPVPNGALLTIKASVNRVFGRSLEIGALVLSLPPGGTEEEHVCSAYLTFVALDADGNPREAPPIRPETPEEKRRYEQALRRRESRLALQTELKGDHGAAGAPVPKTGASGATDGAA